MLYLVALQTHHVFRHAQSHFISSQTWNIQQCIEDRCKVVSSQQSLQLVLLVLRQTCSSLSRCEWLETVLTNLAIYFIVRRYLLVEQLLDQQDSQIVVQIWRRQWEMLCSAQSRISSLYWLDTDSRFIKVGKKSSLFPPESDVDHEDIQAENRKEIAAQIIQSARCRAKDWKRSQKCEERDSTVLDRSRRARDVDYLVESSLSLQKSISNFWRWICRALRVRLSRNRYARAWFVPNLCTWCASLVEDFLLDLALEYAASREHRWIVSITIVVHRREASALRHYHWDFTIRVEENRWSMSREKWAHRRNWRFRTSEMNVTWSSSDILLRFQWNSIVFDLSPYFEHFMRIFPFVLFILLLYRLFNHLRLMITKSTSFRDIQNDFSL